MIDIEELVCPHIVHPNLKLHIPRCPRIGSGNQKLSNGQKPPLRISHMKRGEVWSTNFDPSVSGKISKKRPDVIVSNDASNICLNRVEVIPVARKIDRLNPS